MNDSSLIGRILQIEKGKECTLELRDGFFEGFEIDVDYKDRKAIEIMQSLSEDLEGGTMQDIVDVANRIVAWVGLFEVLNKNKVGGSDGED